MEISSLSLRKFIRDKQRDDCGKNNNVSLRLRSPKWEVKNIYLIIPHSKRVYIFKAYFFEALFEPISDYGAEKFLLGKRFICSKKFSCQHPFHNMVICQGEICEPNSLG